MKFALILLFLSLEATSADSCDEIRDPSLCSASPETCYWDTTKEKLGHACMKFSYSGECTQIPIGVDSDCTGAGQGLLCDIFTSPNGSKVCWSKCSRWNENSTYCEGGNHHHCRYSSSTCLSCPQLAETACKSSANHCHWNGSACEIGCRTLHDSFSCLYDEICFYDYVNNYCSDFESCASISDATSCNSAQQGCTYSGGVCKLYTPPCSSHNQVQCAADSSCYYDSFQDLCDVFLYIYGGSYNASECGNLKYSSDCASAQWNAGGTTYKACEWKSDQIGCVSKCTDFPRVSTGDIFSTFITDCEGRSDCWWDPAPVGGYFTGCKDFSGSCTTFNSRQSICNLYGAICYWNNTVCSNYEKCSEINQILPCQSTSKCKWNDTACVDQCGQISNEHDCLDRPDCRYDLVTLSCVDFYNDCNLRITPSDCNDYSNCWWGYSSCQNYSSCMLINNIAACSHLSKRCSWNLGENECLDEIYSPEIDENRKGCGAYSKAASCNADNVTTTTDNHVGCVWNNEVCVNFTTCESISHVNFGGNFTLPNTACETKNCTWKAPEYSGVTCGSNGWCVAHVKPCREYIAEAACNTAAGSSISENENGCYWDVGNEQCEEFNCTWYHGSKGFCDAAISKGRKCEWDNDFSICIPACSRHKTMYQCEQDYFYFPCYWDTDSGACASSTMTTVASDIKRAAYCTSLSISGVWLATDPLDVSIGKCFESYEFLNLEVRGCDDYLNAEQCHNDIASVTSSSYATACEWIWNADRTGGKCIRYNTSSSPFNLDFINCTEYQNKDQCVYATTVLGVPLCFWKSNAPDGQHCHQHSSDCSDVPLTDCDNSYLCAKKNRTASEMVCDTVWGGLSSLSTFCNEYNNSQASCDAHVLCEYYSTTTSGSFCGPVDCSAYLTRNNCEKHNNKCVWRKYFYDIGGTCTHAYVKEGDIPNTLTYQLELIHSCDRFSEDTVGCNQNYHSCNGFGCVYNSRSNSCINFRNCSDIAFPYFQDPETDCNAKEPFCFWNDDKCSTEAPPPKGEEKKKLSRAAIIGIIVGSSVLFLLIVIAIIIILVVYHRKKRVAAGGAGNDADRQPLRNEEANHEETQVQEQTPEQEQGQEQAGGQAKMAEIEPTDSGDNSGPESLPQQTE